MTSSTPAYRGSLFRRTRELADWHSQGPCEVALEPGLPIVDPHHHLYGTAGDDHFYRLADLEADLAGGHRIVATVYVEAYQSGWHAMGPEPLRPVGEVDRIVRLTAAASDAAGSRCRIAAGIVSHADLALGDAVAQVLDLQAAAGQGRLRGVRHSAAYEAGEVGRFAKGPGRPHLLADPSFRRGVAQVERAGLGFDAWVYHPQLPDVAALADAFPNLPIVLNHAGGLIGVAGYAGDRVRQVAQWTRDLRALAARPNVSVKVGGFGMPVFGFGFEHAARPPTSIQLALAWQPLVATCIEAFGTRRCMFEGNLPVDKQSCGATELWNAFKRISAGLSADERADLFHRTACRLYRLPDVS